MMAPHGESIPVVFLCSDGQAGAQATWTAFSSRLKHPNSDSDIDAALLRSGPGVAVGADADRECERQSEEGSADSVHDRPVRVTRKRRKQTNKQAFYTYRRRQIIHADMGGEASSPRSAPQSPLRAPPVARQRGSSPCPPRRTGLSVHRPRLRWH